MPAELANFRDLMQAVLNGDPVATEQFCRDYQSHILRIVRYRLLRRLRSRYDSFDFVNDVWVSFFAAPPHDVQFDGPDAVVAYLEAMARRKVIQTVRRQQSLKYNIHRERPLPEAGPGSYGVPLPAADPTPSHVASAKEQWERLLRRQPSKEDRALVTMLASGMTHREIAARLHTTERTVHRLIRRLDLRPDPS